MAAESMNSAATFAEVMDTRDPVDPLIKSHGPERSPISQEKTPSLRGLDIRYKINDVPPWYLCLLLGFQHFLTMFGGTAALPLIFAPFLCLPRQSVEISEILNTLFFVSGLVTIMQATVGTRLPIIQGASYSFIMPAFAILSLPKWKNQAQTSGLNSNNATTSWVGKNYYNMTSFENISLRNVGPFARVDPDLWKPRLLEIQGALITASIFEIIVGATGIIGFLMKYIGPLTITPTITLIGLALFDEASKTCSLQWGVALLTMVLISVFSQYLGKVNIPLGVDCKREKDKNAPSRNMKFPIFAMFPIILAIAVVWLLCVILTVAGAIKNDPDAVGYNARTDLNTDALYQARWFRFPYPFQWGVPTFNLAGSLGMLAAILTSMIESVGDYYACAKLSGAPPPPIHAINRGITIEGIGCVLCGMFGTTTGTTSFSENIGAIGITKVGSRRVIQMAGGIMVILGLFGKFGALFVTIPIPIVGGMFMVMFGIITAVGLSNLQYVNLNSSRNLFIVGLSILFGLSLPKWMNGYEGSISTGVDAIDQIVSVLLGTSMFIGGLVGFILDNTIPGTLEDRGIKIWRDQMKNPKEPSGSDADISACYEIPLISTWIRKQTWTRYIPVCPTFQSRHITPRSACLRDRTSSTEHEAIQIA